MIDQDIHEEFIQLRVKGLSFDKISKKLNVSKSTLITWSQEHAKTIANLKSIEQEAIFQKHRISKDKEMEIIRKDYEKIQKELESRSLDKTTTAKLYELRDKYSEKLRDNSDGIKFLGKKTGEQLTYEHDLKINMDTEWRA